MITREKKMKKGQSIQKCNVIHHCNNYYLLRQKITLKSPFKMIFIKLIAQFIFSSSSYSINMRSYENLESLS